MHKQTLVPIVENKNAIAGRFSMRKHKVGDIKWHRDAVGRVVCDIDSLKVAMGMPGYQHPVVHNKVVSGTGGYGRNLLLRAMSNDVTYPIVILQVKLVREPTPQLMGIQTFRRRYFLVLIFSSLSCQTTPSSLVYLFQAPTSQMVPIQSLDYLWAHNFSVALLFRQLSQKAQMRTLQSNTHSPSQQLNLLYVQKSFTAHQDTNHHHSRV